MPARKFTIRNMFTEEDGKPSFSRLFSAMVIIVMLTLISFVTLKNGQLPDLGGAALFTPGTVTALYAFNKIATAIGEAIRR